MKAPRVVLTIALPPLSVYVRTGFAGVFWLNVVLTLFFYLPGVAHAFWVLRRPRVSQSQPRPRRKSKRVTSRD